VDRRVENEGYLGRIGYSTADIKSGVLSGNANGSNSPINPWTEVAGEGEGRCAAGRSHAGACLDNQRAANRNKLVNVVHKMPMSSDLLKLKILLSFM